MNINIKELFKSDLDPNSSTWWSKDKLDKLNFNFYQFINGGMPGPQGTKGPDGDYGYMGPKGPQGFIGADGYQGQAGTPSASEWILWTPTDINIPQYLFPKVRQTIGFFEQLPVVLKTGYLNPLLELPEDYIGAVKTVISSPLNGGIGNQSMIGLRLQHDGKVADFRTKLTGNFLDMEIGRIVSGDPNFDLLNVSDEIIYEIAGTNYIKVTETLVTFGGNINIITNINKAYSHDQFIINQNALPGNVLVSESTLGKVKWVDKKSVFGSFPVGSIISIRPADFNSTNFHLVETIIQPGPPYTELQVIYGKGKVGGEYEGWYLCNGEKWKVANGVSEFQTPNLSSFNYTISDNNGGQPLTSGGDNSTIIVGGSDIDVVATTDNLGNYQVNMTIESADETLEVTPQVTNTTYASRMIHIVFLNLSNLHWSNSTFAPPPPTTSTISLNLTGAYPRYACEKIPIYQYTWTGLNTQEWTTFNYVTTPRYLYNFGTTTFAPAGWYGNNAYSNNGIARFWNGSQFTDLVNCPPIVITNTANLLTASSVFDLNDPMVPGSGDDYDIDDIEFEYATSLEFGGVGAAPEGWYRDTNTGVRRYWDGAGFIGATLYTNYISEINNIYYSTLNSIGVCGANGSLRTTYIDSDIIPTVYNNISEFIGEILYVNYQWAGGNLGTGPLMKAIALNAPGTTVKYKTIYRTYMYEVNQYGINDIINVRTWGSIDQTLGYISTDGICQ